MIENQIIFLFSAILCFVKLTKKQIIFIFLFFEISLLFIAVFRNELLPDYSVYVDIYNQSFNPSTEISFSVISFIVKNVFHDFHLLLFIYAFIAISIKLRVIYTYSPLPFLCLLVYLSHYFLLNEMVQMRAGVASAFLLLAIEPLTYRKFKKFALYIFIASVFHYSFIVLIFLYFFKCDKFSLKFYFFATIFCLGMYITKFNVLGPVGDIMNQYSRLSIYLNNESVEYSFFPITRWLCFIIILFYIKYMKLKDPYIYVLVNIYFSSLCVLLIFNQIPAIGIRYSELLGSVEILLLPLLAYLVKPRCLGVLGVVLYCVYIFHSTSIGILNKM